MSDIRAVPLVEPLDRAQRRASGAWTAIPSRRWSLRQRSSAPGPRDAGYARADKPSKTVHQPARCSLAASSDNRLAIGQATNLRDAAGLECHSAALAVATCMDARRRRATRMRAGDLRQTRQPAGCADRDPAWGAGRTWLCARSGRAGARRSAQPVARRGSRRRYLLS